LIVIDYQPVQVGSVASMDRRELVTNIVAVARTAKLFGVPIVLSTVNVKAGVNQPTIHQLVDVLGGIETVDRTTINAWEDKEFVDAVGGTSVEAHRAALDRVAQAGARPASWVQLLCELLRDWLRKETARQFAEILFAVEGR
jgi:nicotinamidase-related amidase